MCEQLAGKIVHDFERGRISRRELVARLLGLGAAMAGISPTAAWSQSTTQSPGQRIDSVQGDSKATEPTFRASGLNHLAIDVTDVARSRDFYIQHLGLRVIRGDDNAMFLGQGNEFFLTLFRRDRAGLNHYCYSIPRYQPESDFEKLAAAGLRPRREGGRIYFSDPDGITVQIAQERQP